MTTLLIDGDIPCYKIAAATEVAIDDGDGWVAAYMDKHEATAELDAWVNTLKKTLEADSVILALTHKANFRKGILPSYKENRVGQRKPIGLQALKKHVYESYDTYVRDGLEADDVLGILSTSPSIITGRKIIISIDKDFKTIPGLLYNPDKPLEGVVEVSENEANYWHFYQTLVGDKTDGYAGCPGIGPKNAEKILAGTTEWWPAVVKAFAKAGLGEQEALTQARVARILRACDFDFTQRKPILWNPPNTQAWSAV